MILINILIVDPNVQELTQLKSGLESAGYEGVVSTESVREALGYYGVDSSGKLPSDVELILMDLTSPNAIESGFRIKPRQSRSASRAGLGYVGCIDAHHERHPSSAVASE